MECLIDKLRQRMMVGIKLVKWMNNLIKDMDTLVQMKLFRIKFRRLRN